MMDTIKEADDEILQDLQMLPEGCKQVGHKTVNKTLNDCFCKE